MVGVLFLPPCLLNGLSGVSVALRVESLSPVLFFFPPQDKLNFTSSGLIKPFVSKIVTQPLGGWNPLLLPYIPPAESDEKTSDRGEGVPPPTAPSLPRPGPASL